LLQALFDRFGTLARGAGDVPPRARPFDRERDGFLTGEGAAVVLLEQDAVRTARGGQVQARLLGGGEAFDPTASRCGWGTGHERLGHALRRTLERCGLAPADVDLVVSGASGARDGDRLEALTLRSAWEAASRDDGRTAPLPPVVAPRGFLGLLGGGVLAAAVLLTGEAWNGHGRPLELGPSAGFASVDPELGLSPHGGGPLPPPGDRPGRAPGPPRVLVQIIAAGGTAAWLLLEAPDPAAGADTPGQDEVTS
jgi:beta-ketoacyl ACP synthase